MRTRKPRRRSTGAVFIPEPTCHYCGKRGSHYVPPSCGEPAFLICDGVRKPVPAIKGSGDYTLTLPDGTQRKIAGGWGGREPSLPIDLTTPSTKDTK
jgi:hypothetical protein